MDIQTEEPSNNNHAGTPNRWSRPEGSDHSDAGDEGSEASRVLDGVGSDEGFAVLK